MSDKDVLATEIVKRYSLYAGGAGLIPVPLVDFAAITAIELKMLAEILGMPDAVDFRDESYAGHYVRTPYAYLPRLGRRYTPPLHVDLGQGLLELIDEVRSATGRKQGAARQ